MFVRPPRTDILWSKWEWFIKLRAAFLAPILLWVMNEGISKKAALILMKHSHFDRTPQLLVVRSTRCAVWRPITLVVSNLRFLLLYIPCGVLKAKLFLQKNYLKMPRRLWWIAVIHQFNLVPYMWMVVVLAAIWGNLGHQLLWVWMPGIALWDEYTKGALKRCPDHQWNILSDIILFISLSCLPSFFLKKISGWLNKAEAAYSLGRMKNFN